MNAINEDGTVEETVTVSEESPVKRKRKKADLDGNVSDIHAPSTLDEAKALRSAGLDVSTDNLSVDDKRQFIEWLEAFQSSPQLAPKRGNEKLCWEMRPTTLKKLSGTSATDGLITCELGLTIEFEDEELASLPQCIAKPASALLAESRRTDSGKNSARVLVRRDWRTLTYTFQSPKTDAIKLVADIKGEPEFVVVGDQQGDRLALKIKLHGQLGGAAFAQLAQLLQSEVLETQAIEEQLSLLDA